MMHIKIQYVKPNYVDQLLFLILCQSTNTVVAFLLTNAVPYIGGLGHYSWPPFPHDVGSISCVNAFWCIDYYLFIIDWKLPFSFVLYLMYSLIISLHLATSKILKSLQTHHWSFQVGEREEAFSKWIDGIMFQLSVIQTIQYDTNKNVSDVRATSCDEASDDVKMIVSYHRILYDLLPDNRYPRNSDQQLSVIQPLPNRCKISLARLDIARVQTSAQMMSRSMYDPGPG